MHYLVPEIAIRLRRTFGGLLAMMETGSSFDKLRTNGRKWSLAMREEERIAMGFAPSQK